jgi:predicted transcriptional regulator
MRTYLAMAAVAAMITGTAMAQPANRDANTPAVNTPNTPPNPGAPVAGSNSFTEGQAKSRIESNGFSNVSELRKDDQGVWRGKAMKDGKSVTVSLDFQGNVTAQRGGAVVSARVPDADAARLQAIMDRSAVNVRERAAAYRQTGWQSFNSNEGPYTADQVRKERELYMRR